MRGVKRALPVAAALLLPLSLGACGAPDGEESEQEERGDGEEREGDD